MRSWLMLSLIIITQQCYVLCLSLKCRRSVLRLVNVQKQMGHWWISGLCVKKWFFIWPTIRPHNLHTNAPFASLLKYFRCSTSVFTPSSVLTGNRKEYMINSSVFVHGDSKHKKKNKQAMLTRQKKLTMSFSTPIFRGL